MSLAHPVIVSVLAISVLQCAASASAVEIELTGRVIGRTPTLVGYNAGHFMPGSNTSDWWRYSGVNAARVWSTPNEVEGRDDNDVWGDGVKSSSDFDRRKKALRADPLNTEFINWPHFESRYKNNTTNSNVAKLDYAFGELHRLRIKTLAVIHRTVGSYPFGEAGTQDGWADRWEHWQHFYAQAFHLARHFDVERFHMYNEPNHSLQSDVSQAEYIERLQLATDAVRSAIADVNRLYDKKLTAQMQAPVTAGGSSRFHAASGGDTRDDRTGWGELVLDNLHKTHSGRTDRDFRLIETYAYQQYNKTGETSGEELRKIKSMLKSAARRDEIGVAITEFNVHTASEFGKMAETLETPAKFSRLGAILANLANAEPDELYVFKFSQTAYNDGNVKKNGLHYVDNQHRPHDIGGATKAAEVVRLFTKGFAGGHDLLGGRAQQLTGQSFCASRHDGTIYLFAANESESDVQLNLDLSRTEIPTGSAITIGEVSSERHGEVAATDSLASNRKFTFEQRRESVCLISITPGHGQPVTLEATDDAMLKAGGNSSGNYGESKNLYAKNSPDNSGARNVSVIKFELAGVQPATVRRAVLRVHGENVGRVESAIAHVYGLLDDDWNEDDVSWNACSNLAVTNGSIESIADNFVSGIGQTAFFIGHVTVGSTPKDVRLDVTKFVKRHPDRTLTFLLAREFRVPGENVDDSMSSIRLSSRQADGQTGPRLELLIDP